MRCPPCHTPMQVREFWDDSEGATLTWTKGWQCGRCGYGINPLAELNRRFAESPKERSVRGEPIRYWEDC